MTVTDFVLAQLPESAMRVLEVGCGAGDLARALSDAGYDVIAIDPEAPEGPPFRRVALEDFGESRPFDAVVANRSLHHIKDLAGALGKIARLLEPNGVLVVNEFAWDRADAATAEWYYGQRDVLAAARGERIVGARDDPQARWCTGYEGLHGYEQMRPELDARFVERLFSWEPYLYSELNGVASEGLERTLIASGAIRATGFRYVGVPR